MYSNVLAGPFRHHNDYRACILFLARGFRPRSSDCQGALEQATCAPAEATHEAMERPQPHTSSDKAKAVGGATSFDDTCALAISFLFVASMSCRGL